ncbi:CHAT domain-containing protein [Formosa maritima]|uniref:CHAT domain-containing protein n=1 Tax=Formosa maritima TaxID=2592046 RepID=A0A5D0GCY1_9FLAO|nr:CHAT domain-containing tetratricopeptide repeat protein [Formosa maritima]TYA55687.1 CHAT domain-containing protein [Formosa maritima]
MNYLRVLFFCFLPFFGLSQESIITINTSIADSLDNIGEYDESIKFRKLALDEPDHSANYKTYLKAKWLYTKSCILETRGGRKNILEGLEKSKEAYRLVENIISQDDRKLFFRHLILNRIYHQYGYTGQWQEALIEAKKNYEVLRDTFPEYKIEILYVLDDLGFINNKLDNPEKSNEYYERSFKLYKEFHPKNLKDVYLNNHRIINNYRKLGLKNEEFKLLEESENYWANIYNEEDAFFQKFTIYGELTNWHLNYGNQELAESYLYKKEELFDSVANSRKKTEKITLVKRERVLMNESYIKLYLKHKDYDKAKQFIDETQEILKDSLDKYRWNIESKANLNLTEAKLPSIEFKTAEKLIVDALLLLETYKEVYFINPLQYQIELFDLYVAHNKKEKALELMETILKNEELTKHDKLNLLFKKSFLLKESLTQDQLEIQFKTAFASLLKNQNSSSNLASLEISDLNEFYTFEILNNILEVANQYLDWYNVSNNDAFLTVAINLFKLSSNFFDRIYKGDAFNDKLYQSFTLIQEGLLKCALLKPSTQLLETTVEAIENNSSKLEWSKFLYGNQAKINVPDSLLLEEEKLKSLVNYYQERIYEEKQSQIENTDTLKLHLTDLNNQLRKHQKFIHDNFIQYAKSSSNDFNIQDLKKLLQYNEAVVKYILVQEDLYVFTITNKLIDLQKIHNGDNFTKEIKNFVDAISTFNSELLIPDLLKKLANPIIKTDLEHVVIIHSGLLNLLPFEVLLPDYFNSKNVLSYSNSLKIYLEQTKAQSSIKNLDVGIFVAQNKNNFNQKGFLPELDREINGIKENVHATDYYIKNQNDLLEHLRSHNVLHFGIHTTIDIDTPELSVLNFAESGLLIGSLYNTALKADLAVLSACDTGNGRFINGEGVQSISKAFTYAGVPSTVMSLWKVDDKATATLMTLFYKYLNDGKPKDLALKLAKKDYLNSNIDEELKHPYYWSGFVISGNTKPFKPQRDYKLLWFLILVFPAMALVYYKKSKFRK